MSLALSAPGQEALHRIEAQLGATVAWDRLLEGNPNPDRAALNLDRWLGATGNPATYLQAALDFDALPRLLRVMGSSQHLADGLIQNPELGSLFLDQGFLQHGFDSFQQELGELLQTATSPSHALDRLRYFRQKWNLVIAANDLGGSWPQETVWLNLSRLAQHLIAETVRLLWRQAGEEGEPPLMVVAFGKLGGDELNYSSDVDLVYVSLDGISEQDDRKLTRFCEGLNRALEQKMGRGSLYRVDLRLRPYGGTGPIVRTMRAYEAYYELYAEPWERLALLRSAPIQLGPEELRSRWEALRVAHCFPERMSEPVLEQLLDMRTAIEEIGKGDDLKRGVGGIRDIEFLTQLLQMLHGAAHPEVQVRPTLQALRELQQAQILDPASASSLAHAYEFLRKLEHRCQIGGDLQTHTVPEEAEPRDELGHLMGFDSWETLSAQLEMHRRTARTLYHAFLRPQHRGVDDRSRAATAVGSSAQALLQWFDVLPESDAFYSSLVDNESSLDRVKAILESAPVLVEPLRQSVALTELLLSGEIEEMHDASLRIRKLPLDCDLRTLASATVYARTAVLARWALLGTDAGLELSDLADAVLRHCARRLYAEFDILALGSYGIQELSLSSDLDVLFLVPNGDRQADCEAQAQSLLGLVANLRRMGAPISLDLRLRPDGGKGLLVRSHAGLQQYDLQGMEMWERYAICQAREVHAPSQGENGSATSLALVRKLAYAVPLSPERLTELLDMKKRMETERVLPQHARREVKLGYGGLNDLEWFVHLHEMRYPVETEAGTHVRMPERIHALSRAGLIHAGEVEELVEAHRHLVETRMRLALMGFVKDTVPENPDKLDRLARAMGLADGNEFLRRHEPLIERVRGMLREGQERLKR